MEIMEKGSEPEKNGMPWKRFGKADHLREHPSDHSSDHFPEHPSDHPSSRASSEKAQTLLEEYTISSEGMDVRVKIIRKGFYGKVYHLASPVFSAATQALMNEMKKEIISEISISEREILDVNVIKKLKDRVTIKLKEIMHKELPEGEASHAYIIGTLVHSMLGLGNVEFLLNDPNLEEIRINSSVEMVWVYHRKHGWLTTNVELASEAESKNYADIMARRVGKQVNVLNPLLDAHLITGDRVNVVLYPISTKGNTITIRKFARDPWTLTDMIKNGTASTGMMSLIWLAMEYEMNILISGGTGSG